MTYLDDQRKLGPESPARLDEWERMTRENIAELKAELQKGAMPLS